MASSPKRPKKKTLILIFAAVLIIALLAILYFALKDTEAFKIFESTQALQEYVGGFGAWAPAIFILLQIAQVIIAPIPGNVTTLAGGAMFGFWPALAYSTIAILIGSLIAFGIGRVCGRPLVNKLAPADVVDKYLNVLAGKQRMTLALMFLFPFFPDDVLCLLAGLTGYSWGWFRCTEYAAVGLGCADCAGCRCHIWFHSIRKPFGGLAALQNTQKKRGAVTPLLLTYFCDDSLCFDEEFLAAVEILVLFALKVHTVSEQLRDLAVMPPVGYRIREDQLVEKIHLRRISPSRFDIAHKHDAASL